MIKRPLIWMLAAFLAGMYLAWQGLSVIYVVIFGLLICISIYLFMFRIRNRIINSHDCFLWCLPVLMVAGYLAMGSQLAKPALYDRFDSELPCELTGRITRMVEKQKGFSLYVTDNTIYIADEKPFLCENVIIHYYYNGSNSKQLIPSDYRVGNRIIVKGILKKFEKARNPGGFDEELYYQAENIDFKMEAEEISVTDGSYSLYHAFLDKIKRRLYKAYASILADKEAGTITAMLLGEKYLLDDEIKRLYQENGISHILAISGLHISLIGSFLFGLLRRMKCPANIAAFVTIFFLYSYGVLTQFSISTKRSVVMMIIFLLSPLFGKTYDLISSISLSMLILLMQNPLQIFSAGFLLSYGAVLGIALLYPRLRQLFPSENSIINSLLISCSVQLFTTPFILSFFYQLPAYSIIINLLILPLITLLILTSILAGIVGILCLPLGVFIIGGAGYILKLYEWICKVGTSLPANLITVGKPNYIRIFFYFIWIAAFMWITRKYQRKSGILLLAAGILLLLLPQRATGLYVTFLDVGQGDGIFMESQSRTTYLIDGGSSDERKVGTYRITPFLLSRGVETIDYAIVTHSDNDHTSGLTELITGGRITVRNLLMPDISFQDTSYDLLVTLAEEQDIKVSFIKAGDVLQDGKVKITCLHPSTDYPARSSNAYSTVLSVSYLEFDMLLTGDLEMDGERRVMELLKKQDGISAAVDYDILKVAHHGSKSSTGQGLLTLTQPEYAIISCGKGNRYGHPNTETLERLKQACSKTLITYESGAITIHTDGESMVMQEYLELHYARINGY